MTLRLDRLGPYLLQPHHLYVLCRALDGDRHDRGLGLAHDGFGRDVALQQVQLDPAV